MSILGNIQEKLALTVPSIFSIIESLGFGRLFRLVLLQIYLFPKRRLRITEIDKLSHHIPLFAYFFLTPELQKSNDWYGNATWVKRFAGLSNNYSIKAALEHGSVPSKIIFLQDAKNVFPSIITYSKKRRDYLARATGKETFAIGPYIHYAENLISLSEEEKEKKRLGRNLLVFTAHSSVDIRNDYNFKFFCNEISKISKDFDSVRVCLYWRDILYGADKFYRKLGYECVSAGDIFDPLFLPRLKSMISTSSATMSNAIGTYLGYCVFMGKPHYLVSQKIFSSGNKSIIKESKRLEDTEVISDIKKVFGHYTDKITKEQLKIIGPEWGFGQIKSPSEIKAILQKCERLSKRSL